jgi:hypothetical protein
LIIEQENVSRNRRLVTKATLLTNEDGSVIFENVPLSNYVICVEDSKNFMGNKKSLDLIGEQVVQPSFNIFIEIKPQVHSFTEITLKNEEEQNVSKATVTALLLSISEPIKVDRTLPYNNTRLPL